MKMFKTVPMRSLFVLLGLIAAIEMLLMLTLNAALEEANYLNWVRATCDAVLLAVICVPLLYNYQFRPLQMAYHDHLTGLPNRLLLDDRLELALIVAKREKKNCAVIYLDMDRFKPVNDTYGHRVGDAILKQVSERVRGCVRESDTVARIGGDEFIVLLTSIGEASVAERVVQKIVVELTRPFDVNGKNIELGVSAGIALYPKHGKDGIALLDAADDAMYCAKNDSEANYCFASKEV